MDDGHPGVGGVDTQHDVEGRSRELLEGSGSATETIAPTTGPAVDASLTAGVGGSIRAKAARLRHAMRMRTFRW